MKRLVSAAVLACLTLVAPAHADVNTMITLYDVEAYGFGGKAPKLGIIRLKTSELNTVAYLHFHRSPDTLPEDRVYVQDTWVHVHYMADDWERMLALLDHSGPVRFVYEELHEQVYVTRSTAPN
ncbi:MAG TPA: hypothetical protein VF267_06980 [Gammaproteobacteria bacterium]